MKQEKSLIQRLIEKKFDINKVYVGIIGKQYETKAQTQAEIMEDLVSSSWGDLIYRWKYKPVDKPIGLFVKTIGGYKRITSGEIYKESTHKTMDKIVIVKGKVLPLINVYSDLYWTIKEKSNYINLKEARLIEKQLNENNVALDKVLNSLS